MKTHKDLKGFPLHNLERREGSLVPYIYICFYNITLDSKESDASEKSEWNFTKDHCQITNPKDAQNPSKITMHFCIVWSFHYGEIHYPYDPWKFTFTSMAFQPSSSQGSLQWLVTIPMCIFIYIQLGSVIPYIKQPIRVLITDRVTIILHVPSEHSTSFCVREHRHSRWTCSQVGKKRVGI